MSVSLFIKSIETLDADDVAGVIGWPESLTVEYKEALPTKKGCVHAWTDGGVLDPFARDKILKEVIALANTSGGHVVLGIAETESLPAVARVVVPIPRCVHLAERLDQAAQQIDPPIPLLLVRGVEISSGAGVVVFRVPASRSAPHRGLDKECYVRRGTCSVPVGMREIQDLTIAVGRRGEYLEKRLGEADASFRSWISSPVDTGEPRRCGFHIGACPASVPFSLGRLDGATIPLPQQSLQATFAQSTRNLNALHPPTQRRAILRGLRYSDDTQMASTYMSLQADGLISFGFRTGVTSGSMRLYLDWLIGHACNVIRVINWTRERVGQADTEYAIEVSIMKYLDPQQPLHLYGFGESSRPTEALYLYLTEPLQLPRLSYGLPTEGNHILNILLGDLLNAFGAQAPDVDYLCVAYLDQPT